MVNQEQEVVINSSELAYFPLSADPANRTQYLKLYSQSCAHTNTPILAEMLRLRSTLSPKSSFF